MTDSETKLTYLTQMAKKFLLNPFGYEWTTQGLGMLRLYLTPDIRLHLWHSMLEVPDATKIHNHPWDFEATILAGRIVNRRFKLTEPGPGHDRFMETKILCGQGTTVREEIGYVSLMQSLCESMGRGQRYSQRADEIHCTEAMSGTVTIVERMSYNQDPDHALVYVSQGEQFVSAEPRPATIEEIAQVTRVVSMGLR